MKAIITSLFLSAGLIFFISFIAYSTNEMIDKVEGASTRRSTLKVENEYLFPVTFNPQMTPDGRTIQSGSTTVQPIQGSLNEN